MVAPIPEAHYSVKWSDDFAGPAGAIDTTKWKIIISKPGDPGRDSNEKQSYTASSSNISLSGSDTLQITPQKDGAAGWTSARIQGKFAYACPPGKRMLLQAELRLGSAPACKQAGIWPAFWALGNSFKHGTGWPQCGEWDIMETAYGQRATLASLHYGADVGAIRSQGGGGNPSAWTDLDVTQFHRYTIQVNRSDTDWRKERIEWFVDGTSWFTATGADVNDEYWWSVLAHSPFFPILNVAVGSGFPTQDRSPGKYQPDENTATGLDTGMEVRYVAFYESDYSGYPEGETGHSDL